MKIMKHVLFLLTFVWLGCSGFQDKTAQYSGAAKTNEIGNTTTDKITTNTGKKRATKVIKKGSIYAKIEDFDVTKEKILNEIKKFDVYIAQETENNYSYEKRSEIIIRIPKEYFDTTITVIVGFCKKIDSKNINLQDVTEEYYDIETRLKNKKSVEQSYRELLEKAKNIGDILSIQEHLRIVREEIEVAEGRLKYLDDRVKYSTLNLTVYERYDAVSSSFGQKMIDAISNGWQAFLLFLVGLTSAWPFLLLIVAVILFIRHLIRKKRKKKQVKEPKS